MTNRLSEKVCIITGTGGEMGREAALIFAREGALIVGCGGVYVEDAEATEPVVRAAGGTMVSMQPCDLTKAAECQALVDFVVRSFGRIDVLSGFGRSRIWDPRQFDFARSDRNQPGARATQRS